MPPHADGPELGPDEPGAEPTPLEGLIYERLSAYARSLQGHAPEDMYRLIMPQFERPLIRVALELSGGARQRAAQMLGIHRNTLRTKMRALGLDDSGPTP